jgi:colanic acid/amylovoran biosynthesis protein
MNILVIGQCSLHWGRMEYGNIGNYYIVEPFFRELHRCFPGSEIRTTMQMSDRFCSTEKITCLPMDLYYGWRINELQLAKNELKISETIKTNGACDQTTTYLDEVKWADIVIDFSGDIWGDNADFLGNDRFEVGLIKDMIAQNLGKPTAMLAGSPGPFSRLETKVLAKEVYAKFDLVTNRDPISTSLLAAQGFDVSKTVTLACPAFLFEPASSTEIADLLQREGLLPQKRKKPIVGFILCGWNFEQGPFDLWPRNDEDYIQFVEGLEFVTEKLGAQVCLMSHANGFDIPPSPFHLKHGRDYHIAKQLQALLTRRGIAKDVICMDGVYDSWQTKTIIGNFDMLISGRIHAAVASLSQFVPTVIIDYGHEPKAHKLMGFATLVGVTEYVSNPVIDNDLIGKIENAWGHRKHIRKFLERRIPEVKNLANQNFTRLASILK